MKTKRIWISAILFSIFLVIFVLIKFPFAHTPYQPPKPKGNEVITTIDKNNDGKIESWIYKNEHGVSLRWIHDSDYDGIPDSWSFFKQGQAFLDEVDFDRDSKVDAIYLNIWNENKTKMRVFSFMLSDKERNIFVEHEDTDWLEESKK